MNIHIMCYLTFPGEVTIIVSFDVIMAMDSIIKCGSLTCIWYVSRSNLITASTHVQGTLPLKMSWVTTLKALVLLTHVAVV
jgi:hypothetical protein